MPADVTWPQSDFNCGFVIFMIYVNMPLESGGGCDAEKTVAVYRPRLWS